MESEFSKYKRAEHSMLAIDIFALINMLKAPLLHRQKSFHR